MIYRFATLGLALVLTLSARAVTLPPEKLLPKDTVFVLTAPDAPKAWSTMTNSPYGKMWADPAVKAFKDKFISNFQTEVLAPIEREFGFKFDDYAGIARGQFTIAVIQNPGATKPEDRYARLLIIDTKDQAGKLRTNLVEVKKKWVDSGKANRTEKIRDLDFTTLITTTSELSNSWAKIFPPKHKGSQPAAGTDDADAPKSENKKIEITFGQADSLLLISDSKAAIEKILGRQSGGMIGALDELPAFQTDYAARLRNTSFYAWLNIKAVVDEFMKDFAAQKDQTKLNALFDPTKVAGALGVYGLTTASFTWRETPEGMLTQIYVGAPESARKGLLKVFAAEPKDSTPPSFVPADATKFNRWRLNLSQSWTTLEKTLADISPSYGGLINFVLESAGKDKDEKYNFKSELLGSLGDDVVGYEKAAPANAPLSDESVPSLYLLGSPNPDKLAATLKIGMGALAPGGAPIKEREFLGRKIYSFTPPTNPNPKDASKGLTFAAANGYVALSADPDLVQDYLRGTENKPKPLMETPGLADAAQKVGGMGTGLFGYSNSAEHMHRLMDALRKDPTAAAALFAGNASNGAMGLTSNIDDPTEQAKRFQQFADFSLLPQFEAISKYFYFSVYSGAFNQDGFTMNFFAPTPPKLK
ncbi:MAG: hypothetical protein ACXWIU_03970 [Limisphaerales bacterium]